MGAAPLNSNDVFVRYTYYGDANLDGVDTLDDFNLWLTGFTTGMLMIWWMNAWDYPITVGGKPLFSPIFASVSF